MNDTNASWLKRSAVAVAVLAVGVGGALLLARIAGRTPEPPVAAVSLTLAGPRHLAAGTDGALYIADTCVVFRLDQGVLEPAVGTGRCGRGVTSGTPRRADIGNTGGLALGPDGRLFISDTSNCLVYAVFGATIERIAGTGVCGVGMVPGRANDVQLGAPGGLAVDAAGRVYIAEGGNCRVLVLASELIDVFAGTGICGEAGEDIPALSANIIGPTDLAVDASGDLYITGPVQCRVRVVSSGMIGTFAGSRDCGYVAPDAPAAALGPVLHFPVALAMAADGTLYVADDKHVSAVRGGEITFLGSTPGEVTGIEVDSAGTVFVSDANHCTVYALREGVPEPVAGDGVCASPQ